MESCAVTKDAGEDRQEEGDADAMSRSEWKTFRRVEADVGWVGLVFGEEAKEKGMYRFTRVGTWRIARSARYEALSKGTWKGRRGCT